MRSLGTAGRSAASRKGQSMVEFALILPLVLLIVINVVNFGVFFYDLITISNAARTGAQYMAIGAASPTAPQSIQSTAVINMIKNEDVLSLLNNASVTVTTCVNNKSGGGDVFRTTVIAGSTGGCTTADRNDPSKILADPEPTHYLLATVDVDYPYQPVIPVWNFPSLGVYATMPPTTIHRRAVFRMVQ